MKKAIFLPILCLLAFVALITVTSCEKQDPIQEDTETRLQGIEFTEDVKFITVDDKQIEVGKKYSILSGEYPTIQKIMEDQGFDFSNVNPNARTVAANMRWTFTNFSSTCFSGYCNALGQELQGSKNISWTQVDAANGYYPYDEMQYKTDPKALRNYTTVNGTMHYYRHINYNAQGNLEFSFFVGDTNGNFWTVDADLVSVPAYGTRTYFETWNETQTVPEFGTLGMWDEDAVDWHYSASN